MTDNNNPQPPESELGPFPIRAMFDVRIPMRDGMTLSADVILPEGEFGFYWTEAEDGFDSIEWQEHETYPPKDMAQKRLYMHSQGNANTLNSDGLLSWDAPGEEPTDQYAFDPRDPSPAFFAPPDAPPVHFHGLDLQEVEAREDVLVYTSEVLEQEVQIAGPVEVELFAASDGLDTDWVVRILDVNPDGKSVNLGPSTFGVLRARYRDGFDKDVLLTPGKPETFRIKLWNIAHVFLPVIQE